jgi:hypothetical protein
MPWDQPSYRPPKRARKKRKKAKAKAKPAPRKKAKKKKAKKKRPRELTPLQVHRSEMLACPKECPYCDPDHPKHTCTYSGCCSPPCADCGVRKETAKDPFYGGDWLCVPCMNKRFAAMPKKKREKAGITFTLAELREFADAGEISAAEARKFAKGKSKRTIDALVKRAAAGRKRRKAEDEAHRKATFHPDPAEFNAEAAAAEHDGWLTIERHKRDVKKHGPTDLYLRRQWGQSTEVAKCQKCGHPGYVGEPHTVRAGSYKTKYMSAKDVREIEAKTGYRFRPRVVSNYTKTKCGAVVKRAKKRKA